MTVNKKKQTKNDIGKDVIREPKWRAKQKHLLSKKKPKARFH